MKTFWSEKIDEILKTDFPLSEIGVNNWALTKDEALIALGKLMEIEIPILGGDVCELNNGIIKYNYDNWYCNRIENESEMEFVIRSHDKAVEYITNYSSSNSNNIYYTIVPGKS